MLKYLSPDLYLPISTKEPLSADLLVWQVSAQTHWAQLDKSGRGGRFWHPAFIFDMVMQNVISLKKKIKVKSKPPEVYITRLDQTQLWVQDSPSGEAPAKCFITADYRNTCRAFPLSENIPSAWHRRRDESRSWCWEGFQSKNPCQWSIIIIINWGFHSFATNVIAGK